MSAIQYEVINLETNEVSQVIDINLGSSDTPVTTVSFIENGVDKTTQFQNPNLDGNYSSNGQYAIRQVDTQLTPNVDGVVTDEGVEVPVSQETRAEIQAGNVDPDTIQNA